MDFNSVANNGSVNFYGMVNPKDAGSWGMNSGTAGAMSGFDDMFNTMMADISSQLTAPLSLNAKGFEPEAYMKQTSASASKTSSTSSWTDYASGNTATASGSYFDSLKMSKPSIDSIKEMFKDLDPKSLKGLTEEQKADKYCEAWMKAQGFDSEQYKAIKEQFAPQKEKMEQIKKEITVKYADKLESKDGAVDAYYEIMIDMQNPDMKPAERKKLISKMKEDYAKHEEQMKELGKELENELGDDPTPSDYFKMMLKRQDPELAKPENADKLQAKVDSIVNSDDFKEMTEFYEEVGDIFVEEPGVGTMLESAEHFVGKGTHAAHGKDLDGQYETITERMEISQASGVNSKDEKWDVGFAVNQMSGNGVLDISSAFVKNKDGEYKAKYDLTKYDDVVKWSKKENVWRDNDEKYKPKVGDAVMFDKDHMGIIYKIKGDKIYTIEGGLTGEDPSGKYKGDGSYVGKRSYDLKDEHIVGFLACTEPEKKKS